MNNIKDFKKKEDRVIVNTNTKDYLRAKKRNYIRKQQELYFGNYNSSGIIPEMAKRFKVIQNNAEMNNQSMIKMKHEVHRLKKDIKEIKDMLIDIGRKM
jgi:hypothetical protein